MPHDQRIAFTNYPARGLTVLLSAGALVLAGTGAATAAGPATGSLAAASTALGSIATPPTDPAGTGTPRLQTVDNFRDVAGNDGDGYSVADGAHMKRGVFYRSNKLLEPSESDRTVLDSLGLTTVYDLRTDDEISSQFTGGEDTVPAGAEYTQIPIDTGDTVAAVMNGEVASPDAARDHMRNIYTDFVTDESDRAGFGALLASLADSDDPQLFHCSEGKDRTGWTAMLLQHIAGASDKTIMRDYLLTNDYTAESIEKTVELIAGAMGPEAGENLRPMLGVETSYLTAGLDQVTASYGDIHSYLIEGLGVDEATIAALRTKLIA